MMETHDDQRYCFIYFYFYCFWLDVAACEGGKTRDIEEEGARRERWEREREERRREEE